MSFVSFYQVRSLERLFKTDFWVYYFADEKKSTVAILVINLMSCEECRSSLTNKFSVSHPVSNDFSFVAHTNKFFHNTADYFFLPSPSILDIFGNLTQ